MIIKQVVIPVSIYLQQMEAQWYLYPLLFHTKAKLFVCVQSIVIAKFVVILTLMSNVLISVLSEQLIVERYIV